MSHPRRVVRRSLSRAHRLVLLMAMALVGCGPETEADVASEQQPIVGGEAVAPCAWPTAVAAEGCSAVLVAPDVVALAAHCLVGGGPREVAFGEQTDRPEHLVAVTSCQRHPDYGLVPGTDVAFCHLASPVDDVPIVPVMSRCEADWLLHDGAAVTLVGFGGVDEEGGGSGIKRSVDVKLEGLLAHGRELVVGTRRRGACHGDSGGPAFFEMPDGTWRTIGVSSRMGPSPDDAAPKSCRSTSVYASLPGNLDWLERASGVDWTPCHDAQGWAPGPRCRDFPHAPQAQGFWKLQCAGPRSTPTATCAPRTSSEAPPSVTPQPPTDVPSGCSLGAPAGGPAGGPPTWLLAILWCTWQCTRRSARAPVVHTSIGDTDGEL